jgi:MFS transporter, DHA2 family, methylenomycin A resistance protein
MKNKNSLEKNIYKYKWFTLLGLFFAIIVLNLDFTIVNLAIPTLGKAFNAPLSLLEWIVNIYPLTFAACVILTGKLADKYGHKKIYLFGITFFLIGSIIAGVAPGPILILIGRILQGVGMAGTYGMMFILAAEAFPANQKGFATGILIIGTGVGQALGPTVGGLMVEYWSWRWCFLINIPFCALSILLVYFACAKDKLTSDIKIHYPSAILIIISFFLIIGPLNESQNWGFSNFKFLILFIGGIVLLLITTIWQKFLKHPIIELNLYKCTIFKAVNLIRPFFQFSAAGFLFIFPIYLQNALGYTAGSAGLVILIMTITIAIVSPITGKLNDKIGPTKPIIVAQIFATIGYILIALMPTNLNWYLLSFGLVLIGSNTGIMYSATNYAVSVNLPVDKKGVGFGMFSANSFISVSLGVAITGYLMSKASFSKFYAQILQHPSLHLLHAKTIDILHDINGARPVTKLARYAPDHSDKIISIGKEAMSSGFSTCMWMFAILSFVSLCMCYFLRKKN